jgi:hypothetical protein
MYHLEPIISKRGDEIVPFLDEYLLQYKIDSIVTWRTIRRRSCNGTEIECEA